MHKFDCSHNSSISTFPLGDSDWYPHSTDGEALETVESQKFPYLLWSDATTYL